MERLYFFDNQIRLDWGFGNPNITGSLIAMLMIGCWGLVSFGRVGFWICLLANGCLGMGLVQTFSRGGLVALLAGAVPVLLVYCRRDRTNIVASILLGMGLAFYAWEIGAAKRYGQSIVKEDRSVENRWLIYGSVARMIHDAPDGWGAGRSGDAFRQWYQPVDRREEYASLVSTHATVLVERGWPSRLAYISLWTSTLLICLPSRRQPIRSVAFGVVLCFGVAAMFTHVGKEAWVLLPPAIALTGAVIGRSLCGEWPRVANWLALNLVVVAGFSLLVYVCGSHSNDVQIALRAGVVNVSHASPRTPCRVGILEPSKPVLGSSYGHRIRACLAEKQGELEFFVKWQSMTEVFPEMDVLLLAGDAASRLESTDAVAMRNARSVLMLNPTEPSASLVEIVPRLNEVHYITGALIRTSSQDRWLRILGGNPNAVYARVPMAAQFIPNWTEELKRYAKTDGEL